MSQADSKRKAISSTSSVEFPLDFEIYPNCFTTLLAISIPSEII